MSSEEEQQQHVSTEQDQRSKRALILYASYTGTCRFYAECFKLALEAAGYVVDKFNVSTPATRAECLKKIAPADSYDVVGVGSAIAMGVFIHGLREFVEQPRFDEYFKDNLCFTFCTATSSSEGAGLTGKHMVKRGGKFVYHGFWASTHNYPPLIRTRGLVLAKEDLETPKQHADELVRRLAAGETVKPPSIALSSKLMLAVGFDDKKGGKFGFSKVTVDPSRCIGCGKCVRTCTTGAMRMGDTHIAERGPGCVGCYACYHSCPKGAIKMRYADADRSPQFQFNETYLKMIETADLPKRKRISKAEWDELKARATAKPE
ncbi:4Fe-4S dicluster domain [Carpediemonas membranifera]|uniref:4Fe-4S dicluster domain n=1 Tax=Carpediemonas membranifera TaxID=201153 RepID=A0A8J6AVE3_9EUKA|nr:4Fe-4S dicluster domain [Carpediemonas membranifera]|eukprot:KAG9395158.1 4Fe-4S dicluster domain [Carpediemonas membranifera]